MRVLVAGPVEAKQGQKVRFTARLRKGEHYAFLQVFSAVGNYDPSPFVPRYKLGVTKTGRPNMVNPTTLRLTSQVRPRQELEITADEDSRFYLYQEVDTAKDKLVKGYAYVYRNRLQAFFAQALGWLRRNPRG